MLFSPLMRLFSIVFVFCIGAVNAHAVPFGNGSFEQPGGPAGTRRIISSGENVGGWVNGLQGTQLYQTSRSDNIDSQEGQFYVSFGHNGTTGGTLLQTFDTEVGVTYEVNYFLASQQGLDTSQKAAAFVYDQVDTTSSAYLAGETNDFSTPNTWEPGKTVRFVARSAQSTLVFQDLTPNGGGSGANWAVDTVTVTKANGGTPTTPAVTSPTFTATVTGQSYQQTLVGNINVGSANVGEALQVYVLVQLRNGLLLAKSGTGNSWMLIPQNFVDIPAAQSFTGSTSTLVVPIYADTNMDGLGAVVYLGFGKTLVDMITTGKFALLFKTQ